MSIQVAAGPWIPAWVYAESFPEADEDALTQLAASWQRAGDAFTTRAREVQTQGSSLQESHRGTAADAEQARLAEVAAWITRAGEASRQTADSCHESADLVTRAKQAMNEVLRALLVASARSLADATLQGPVGLAGMGVRLRQLQIVAQARLQALAAALGARLSALPFPSDLGAAPSDPPGFDRAAAREDAEVVSGAAAHAREVAARPQPDPRTGAAHLALDATQRSGLQKSADRVLDGTASPEEKWPSMNALTGARGAAGLAVGPAGATRPADPQDPADALPADAQSLIDDSPEVTVEEMADAGVEQPAVEPTTDSLPADLASQQSPGVPDPEGRKDGGGSPGGQIPTDALPGGPGGGRPTDQDATAANTGDQSGGPQPDAPDPGAAPSPRSGGGSPPEPVGGPGVSDPSAKGPGSAGSGGGPTPSGQPAAGTAPSTDTGTGAGAGGPGVPSHPERVDPGTSDGDSGNGHPGGGSDQRPDPGTDSAGESQLHPESPGRQPSPHPGSSGPGPGIDGQHGPRPGQLPSPDPSPPETGSPEPRPPESRSPDPTPARPPGTSSAGIVEPTQTTAGPSVGPSTGITSGVPTAPTGPGASAPSAGQPGVPPAPQSGPLGSPLAGGPSGAAPVTGGSPALSAGIPGGGVPGGGVPGGGVNAPIVGPNAGAPNASGTPGTGSGGPPAATHLSSPGGQTPSTTAANEPSRPADPTGVPPLAMLSRPRGGANRDVGGSVRDLRFGPDQLDEVDHALADRIHPSVLQQVLRPWEVDEFLGGRRTTIRGLLHPALQVNHLRTPEQVFDALGLGFSVADGEGRRYTPFDRGAETIEVLRFEPPGELDLIRPVAADWDPGVTGERAMIRDHRAPWSGTGMAPGSTTQHPIEELELLGHLRGPVPHRAEIWRLYATGSAEPVAVFDALAERWSTQLPGASQPAVPLPGVPLPGVPLRNGLYAEVDGVLQPAVEIDADQLLLPSTHDRRVLAGEQVPDLVEITTLAVWRGVRVQVLRAGDEELLVDCLGDDLDQAEAAGFHQLGHGEWEPRWVPRAEVGDQTEFRRPHPRARGEKTVRTK